MRSITWFKTRLAGALIVALCASLVAPAFAVAQQVSPTDDQYGSTLEALDEGSRGTPTGGGAPSGDPPGDPRTGLEGNVGPLPFTGFDVIAMAAVALAVTGLGLLLQRAVAREPHDVV